MALRRVPGPVKSAAVFGSGSAGGGGAYARARMSIKVSRAEELGLGAHVQHRRLQLAHRAPEWEDQVAVRVGLLVPAARVSARLAG